MITVTLKDDDFASGAHFVSLDAGDAFFLCLSVYNGSTNVTVKGRTVDVTYRGVLAVTWEDKPIEKRTSEWHPSESV